SSNSVICAQRGRLCRSTFPALPGRAQRLLAGGTEQCLRSCPSLRKLCKGHDFLAMRMEVQGTDPTTECSRNPLLQPVSAQPLVGVHTKSTEAPLLRISHRGACSRAAQVEDRERHYTDPGSPKSTSFLS